MSKESLETALADWRQGDCVLDEQWFIHIFDPDKPLTSESQKVSTDDDTGDVDFADYSVAGCVVVTQTCDIVRSPIKRPFIEVCPLVSVDQTILEEVRKARRPNYAYIPGIAKQCFVGDLDRVMTVEKTVVSKWRRVTGCSRDSDERAFAEALARKRARFAFPDDFNALASKLINRLKNKHGKQSDEGAALRALDEIRVSAQDSWDADSIDLFFFFIRDSEKLSFNDRSWENYLDSWLRPSGKITSQFDGTAIQRGAIE